jgi:N-acetylneuraminate synthase
MGNALVHGERVTCLVIAEGGVNHGGDRETLLRLVRAAHEAGAGAFKIQVRTPELHADPLKMRESCTAPPGELISELEHRRRLELSDEDLYALDAECKRLGLPWFASAWDAGALERVKPWRPAFYKLASASGTDLDLVRATRRAADETGATVIASTGAMDGDQVDALVDALGYERTILCHAVMSYPLENEAVNMLCLVGLALRYPGMRCGYSGHERGASAISAASVAALAAASFTARKFGEARIPPVPAVIERHLTLDRSMRGSDHAASLEPQGFAQLVRDVRAIEVAMGDGVKGVSDAEKREAARLRRVAT